MITKKYKLHKINIKNSKNGDVIKFINKKSKNYYNFGELYFSEIRYGTVKGWKLHKKMNMNICVPYGRVRFIIFDNKKFTEILLKKDSHILTIFPNTWFAFQGLYEDISLVTNFSDIIHDKKESISKPLTYFDFKW